MNTAKRNALNYYTGSSRSPKSQGLETVRKVEKMGLMSGVPKAEVKVVDSGAL
jgi:hypothetical protein